jgi:hypothetical protein
MAGPSFDGELRVFKEQLYSLDQDLDGKFDSQVDESIAASLDYETDSNGSTEDMYHGAEEFVWPRNDQNLNYRYLRFCRSV